MSNNADIFKLGVDLGIQNEKRRVLEIISQLEAQSHKTRTPLYQETLFDSLREKINQDG